MRFSTKHSPIKRYHSTLTRVPIFSLVNKLLNRNLRALHVEKCLRPLPNQYRHQKLKSKPKLPAFRNSAVRNPPTRPISVKDRPVVTAPGAPPVHSSGAPGRSVPGSGLGRRSCRREVLHAPVQRPGSARWLREICSSRSPQLPRRPNFPTSRHKAAPRSRKRLICF